MVERHGTLSGYVTDGCRCEPCCAAYSTYRGHKTRVPRTEGAFKVPPDFKGHGVIRCLVCGVPVRDHSLLVSCAER
jgi:hypothetical protein